MKQKSYNGQQSRIERRNRQRRIRLGIEKPFDPQTTVEEAAMVLKV